MGPSDHFEITQFRQSHTELPNTCKLLRRSFKKHSYNLVLARHFSLETASKSIYTTAQTKRSLPCFQSKRFPSFIRPRETTKQKTHKKHTNEKDDLFTTDNNGRSSSHESNHAFNV